MRRSFRQEQAEREKYYPVDRIPFLNNGLAHHLDKEAFQMYCEHRISLGDLCVMVARNNRLSDVTPTQMLNELRIIGWI